MSRPTVPKYGLTERQKDALINFKFLDMLRMGENIYYLAKLAVTRGFSVQDASAAFQGITTEGFQAKLTAKGQGLEAFPSVRDHRDPVR